MSPSAERVVLVVAGQDDLASDKIVLSVQRLGADVIRLDLSAAPLRMTCTLNDRRWLGTIQAGDGRELDLNRVGSVFWRWGGKLPGHPAINDPDQRAWAATEDHDAAVGVLRSLPAYWMSHPDRLAAVENAKPVQLRDAATVGLTIPDTLLATHGPAVNSWTADEPCIYKAFRAPYRPSSGDPGWVLATRLTEPAPPELYAASIFQRLIEGTPVRVTVIGRQVVAVEVTGIDYDVDWRPQQTTATLQPITLPSDVRRQVHELMGVWGLTYGALDFIVRPDGTWVFLEVNPTGAWGFVEEVAGLPLSDTIARTLIDEAISWPR